ncbi:MAG: hypothetical protein IT205_03045 [Fimbriimonadaceae bacterium]|nr:hypothetical protein [Fimbriimonadaceae bacterium]
MLSRTQLRYVEATPVCDTSGLAAGDIICSATAIAGATLAENQTAYMTGLDIWDLDDNTAIEMRIVGMSTSTTLGTVNGAPSISDANACTEMLFDITVVAADWHDMGGFKYVRVDPAKMPVPIYTAASSTTIYVTLLVGASGTPTYTASGLVLRAWFQDMTPGY